MAISIDTTRDGVRGTAPGRRPAFSLDDVTLVYEHGTRALSHVTLDVAEGERVCVLGANGSGKSTLASVLAGLLAPDEGGVTLLGESVVTVEKGVDFEAYRRARRQIGLVFQNPDDQIVTSVVEEDIAFGPENLGVPSERIGELVSRELRRVALEDYAKANPSHLSGGQKQRVAIAGTLAMEPRAIVFDEPGALLDVRGRRSILRVMDRLQAAGTTIVHITHFMDEAFEADRVIVMRQGEVALDGTPEEVFSHTDELLELGLNEPFPARLARHLRAQGASVPWTCDAEVLRGELVALLDRAGGNGADVPATPLAGRVTADASPAASGSDAAVEADRVTYSYGGADARRALEDVSFSIRRGTSVAIVGQTGSGKSTLLRLMCALEAPDAGSLVVDGIDTAKKRDRRRLHGRIGYVMQHPERQLFAETVMKDVAYGPRNMRLPDDEVERRCRRALELVGLRGKDDASPFELSGGQRRLCAIAGVLAMEPDVLVLDEPTAGLDPRGRSELRQIIARVHERGVTVVQVTHSMEDAARSEEVIVLNQSRVLLAGAPSEVFSRENARTLHDCGLGIPQPLAWARKLADATGKDLGEPLTTEALARAIAEKTLGQEDVTLPGSEA